MGGHEFVSQKNRFHSILRRIAGLTVLLATRAASKPNSECGNWQVAAKKATRTAATIATSASTATFGRQKKSRIIAHIYTCTCPLPLTPYAPLFLRSATGVSVFAKCNSAAAAVNMLLACFCGFVAHHKSREPTTLVARIRICEFLYLWVSHSICVWVCTCFAKGLPLRTWNPKLSCCCWLSALNKIWHHIMNDLIILHTKIDKETHFFFVVIVWIPTGSCKLID